MPETDLIWMSLLIFIPSIFALGLLFFPRGWDESMRWWSLFGTALTLGVSLAIFVYFRNEALSFHGPENSPEARQKSSLNYRAAKAESLPTGDPDRSMDWVGKIPWVPQFGIHYYLGLDGISLPLVLLTTVLCFLSMIASWRIEKFVRGY